MPCISCPASHADARSGQGEWGEGSPPPPGGGSGIPARRASRPPPPVRTSIPCPAVITIGALRTSVARATGRRCARSPLNDHPGRLRDGGTQGRVRRSAGPRYYKGANISSTGRPGPPTAAWPRASSPALHRRAALPSDSPLSSLRASGKLFRSRALLYWATRPLAEPRAFSVRAEDKAGRR